MNIARIPRFDEGWDSTGATFPFFWMGRR